MSTPPITPAPQAPLLAAPGPAPRKKSGRGCAIALAVVGGLALLSAVALGIGVYAFAQSKEGKAVFGTIGDFTELASEAQNAPGTKEVRALGCDQAMAMDLEKMQRIVADRFDGGASTTSTASVMVICQVGIFDRNTPSCDAVARAYLSGAPQPSRGFTVNVQRGTSGRQPLCSTLYDPDGTKVKDLARGSALPLGGK
jgi:hypothetical protein